MTLLDSWMPTYDMAARYSVRIAASPTHVYEALLATDFGRPWLVRGLMGIRLLPALLKSPRRTWQRLTHGSRTHRASLSDMDQSDFVRLDASPPHEIVLGITGRFWTMAAAIVRIPPEHFRKEIPAGMAQAVWNFHVRDAPGGVELTTETRVRCADAATLRTFTRYWRLVSPGSGLIRHAILQQVRREAMARAG